MENLYYGLKSIILDATKRINKTKPKCFEIALEKLEKDLSDIKELKAYKVEDEVIGVSFYGEPIAHIGGMFLTSFDHYSLFENEVEILFFEDAELEDIEKKYLSFSFVTGKEDDNNFLEFAKDSFNKLSFKDKIISLQIMNQTTTK